MVKRYDPALGGGLESRESGGLVSYEDYTDLEKELQQEKQYRVSAEQYSTKLFAENQSHLDDIEALEKERYELKKRNDTQAASIGDDMHKIELLESALEREVKLSAEARSASDELLRQNASLTGARDGAICEIERLSNSLAEMTLCARESQGWNWLTAQESEYCNETGQYEIDAMRELESLAFLGSTNVIFDNHNREIAARAVESMTEHYARFGLPHMNWTKACSSYATKIRNGDVEL